MQKIATQVFIVASVTFGILGILMVFMMPEKDADQTSFEKALFKCFLVTIFIILTSFALSVAGKYLNGNREK